MSIIKVMMVFMVSTSWFGGGDGGCAGGGSVEVIMGGK